MDSTILPSTCPTTTLIITEGARTLHFILYTMFTFFGIFLNCFLICCLINLIRKNKKSMDVTVYYLIVTHSLTALIYLSCNVVVMLPCMQNCDFYNEYLLKFLASINTIGYYSELFAVCEMTLERILIFFAPSIHQGLGKRACIFLILPWFFGFFMVGLNAIGGCYKKFNPSTFQYITVCEPCDAPMKPILIQFMFILGQAAPGGMFICYLAIIFKVMKTRFAHRTNEKKLVQNFIIVIQFIIICLFQWFSAFFFFMVPYSFGTTLNGVLVTNLCGMLNPSINAIVMFASNKRIKQMLAELFRKRTLLVFITKNSDKTILVKSRIHPSYPEQFSPSAKRGSNMTQVFFQSQQMRRIGAGSKITAEICRKVLEAGFWTSSLAKSSSSPELCHWRQ